MPRQWELQSYPREPPRRWEVASLVSLRLLAYGVCLLHTKISSNSEIVIFSLRFTAKKVPWKKKAYLEKEGRKIARKKKAIFFSKDA